MDKQNIFRSCSFHADAGDIVHVLVKDLVGTLPIISLNDSDGVEEDSTPDVPVATEETDSTYLGFTANWNASSGAHGYYLDVATDIGFTSFVAGYQNLDVGNVTSYVVTVSVGAYYYRVSAYDNNITSAESNIITVLPPYTDIEYGLLYNWYAGSNAKLICNTGWHIPTYAEATAVIAYLGGNAVAGGKMKETGLVYWFIPNTGATNESGFNMRGSATRSGVTGAFGSLRSNASVFINNDLGGQYNYILFSKDNSMAIEGASGVYRTGTSIRPVKDATTLADGETSYYIGNDGKVYHTICIGTQEWVSENLAETKYRDGTDIPQVTDNAAWAALVTDAWCYYNNDSNYM